MKNWSLEIQTLFFSSLVLATTILSTLIANIFKNKINKNKISYLYAFLTGFIIILAIVGLIAGALENIEKHAKDNHFSDLKKIWTTTAIMSGGIISGFVISVSMRFLTIKYAGEIHKNHQQHQHSDHIFNLSKVDNPQKKITIIILLVFHKIISGLTLGLIIFAFKTNSIEVIGIGFIIAFLIHIIPEAIIIHYQQIDIKIKQWKAFLNTFFTSLVMILFMFMGAFLGKLFQSSWWILPTLLATSGTIMTFVSVVELIPEVMHFSYTTKKWYLLIFVFALGMLLSVLLMIYHVH